MDIRVKQFAKIIITITFSFIIMFIALWGIYAYIPIDFYKQLFSVFTIIFLVFGIFLIGLSGLLMVMYKNEKTFIFSPKFIIKILRWIYPLILYVVDIFHYDKKLMNQFFIDMNNIFVDSMELKGTPQDVLILVPHCIQNSDCSIKITSDSSACKECGKCRVAELNHLQKQYGCKVAIATGGTIARRVVKEYNPKYIIAIACERDLISGIMDVNNIPVYGILNQCPNGPCFNTTVDIQKVQNAIMKYTIA